jgi:hypothetical protein
MFQGIASSTRRTYDSAQRKFLEFCRWSQCLHSNGSPLPASEWTLMLFATHLSRTIKAASIKVYLAGIRSLHIENGFPNPLVDCLRLERVLRGIKRSQGVSKRERLPVTFTVLSRLREVLNFECYDDTLFWAACCTGFFGFLRSGEFTTATGKFDSRVHLSVADLWIDRHVDPKVIFLRIKCAKTDPFRQGHTIRLGLSGHVVCAVRALLQYLQLRGGEAGPLFRHANGSPLTSATLTVWLRNAVSRAGIEGNFSGHSFRIGAATSAAAAGIPDHLIKTLGRWFSNAYQLYIQTPNHMLEAIPERIVCTNSLPQE